MVSTEKVRNTKYPIPLLDFKHVPASFTPVNPFSQSLAAKIVKDESILVHCCQNIVKKLKRIQRKKGKIAKESGNIKRKLELSVYLCYLRNAGVEF